MSVNKTNINNVYHKEILNHKITLSPDKINNNKNLNDILYDALNSSIGGKCLTTGYVKPNSLKIISKSFGLVATEKFDGSIIYVINFEADICNPKAGQEIECIVEDNIQSFVVAYINDGSENENHNGGIKKSPIHIYMAKHNHQGDETFIKLQKGDNIKIIVLNSNYEYNDSQIYVLGKFNGYV